MLKHLFKRKINNNNWIFNGSYIDAKALYLYLFDEIPNISYITDVDADKAFAYLREAKLDRSKTFQHSQYDREAGKLLFNVTFMVLANAKIIEIGSDYVSLLHGEDDFDWVNKIMKTISGFKTTHKNADKTAIGFSTQQTMN